MPTIHLAFHGDVIGLVPGIAALSGTFAFETGEGGIPVEVVRLSGAPLVAARNDGILTLRYDRRIHFFRALGLLLEHVGDSGDFRIEETPQFDSTAIMADVSQGNAVLTEESLRATMVRMAAMGLDRLMIYVEDNYLVEGEPYFGYMRGRYTPAQMKSLDDFADALGIEMVPCIQTLAHLIDALKWRCYRDIKDDDDTLLVGSEDTYRFIERLISAASAPFRSKRIHIGMDEAWKLGQGNYLLKNGFREKSLIMQEHLERVLGITGKLGLEPMIWSDMYFRSAGSGISHYNLTAEELAAVEKRIPDGIGLVFWDYYDKDIETYRKWIRNHQATGRPLVFAGGIWSWNGFACDYRMTFETTNAAMVACREENVRDVMATIWGDGGTESAFDSNLLGMQLFAEHAYARELDAEKLASRFHFCTGGHVEDFMALTDLDRIPGTPDPEHNTTNTSHYALWQNPMMGLFDNNLAGLDLDAHYEVLAGRMGLAAGRNGSYGHVFTFMEKLCRVLALKAELGLCIVAAYAAGDRERLAKIAHAEIPELTVRLDDLWRYHRKLWHRTNLPFGWEVMDLRYGALKASLETAGIRLDAYLTGEVEHLVELEEERLDFDSQKGLVYCLPYSRMVSASRLGFSFGF
jgi:hypothetical protein